MGLDLSISAFICTFTAVLFRTVTWPSVHGADQAHHAPHWCSWPGSAVRFALVWSRQGCFGLGGERQGCIFYLWLRGGGQVPAQAWPGSDLSCPSGNYNIVFINKPCVFAWHGGMLAGHADTLDIRTAWHHKLSRELAHTYCVHLTVFLNLFGLWPLKVKQCLLVTPDHWLYMLKKNC